MDIKVSIIIPIYNAGMYLQECLDSIYKQRMKEIEIICINDGSTDNSLEILEDNALKESRIKIISIENNGVGHARNLGLSYASGKRICFMDPDDLYPSEDVLNVLYEKMNDTGVDICGGSAYLLKGREFIKEMPGDKYQFKQDSIKFFEDYQWSYGFWRFMYSREFLINNQITFPQYIRWQDPPFLVKAMILAKKFYAFSKASYIYRLNSSKKNYTYEVTRDCLLGMHDVIEMAGKEDLGELQMETINNINTRLHFPLFHHMLIEKKELFDLLEKIKRKINYMLISSHFTEDNFTFEIEKKLSEYPETRKEKKNLLKECNNFKTIIIYGVGKVGTDLSKFLKSNLPNTLFYYAVSNMSKNLTSHNGISIDLIQNYADYNSTALVIIATKENLHEEIYRNIIKHKFSNIEKISNNLSELIEALNVN